MPSSIADKLKIKAGFTLLALNAPTDFKKGLQPLPAGTTIITSGKQYDQVHWFVMNRAQLEKELSRLMKLLKPDVTVWVYYPKGSSKLQTDLTRDKGWDCLLAEGDKLTWINLDIISQQAFLSQFHFHRIFRQVYRHTPHQYLTRKRIDKAKELLSDNKPVLEVCNEVGFESIGSFSTLFKKESGYAPAYYRNKAWQKKQAAKAQPKKFIPHCFIEGYRIEKP